jgi:hypothetical protein
MGTQSTVGTNNTVGTFMGANAQWVPLSMGNRLGTVDRTMALTSLWALSPVGTIHWARLKALAGH